MLVFIYFLVLLIRVGISNFLVLLLVIELISWIVSIWLSRIRFKYLVVQRYFFLGRLFSLIVMKELLVFFLFLKIGLPPFHSWFIRISSFMNKLLFIFFSTLHKLVSLLALGLIGLLSNYFLIGVISLLFVRTLIIVQRYSFWVVLVASSFIHTYWMALSLKLNLKLFFIYWAIYSIVTRILLLRNYYNIIVFLNYRQGSLTLIIWLCLSGLPPFTVFWLKLNVVVETLSLRLLLTTMLLLSAVARMASYYRIFHLNLALSVNLSKMVLPLLIIRTRLRFLFI